MNTEPNPTIKTATFRPCSCVADCSACDHTTIVPSTIAMDEHAAAALLCPTCASNGCQRRLPSLRAVGVRATAPERLLRLIEAHRNGDDPPNDHEQMIDETSAADLAEDPADRRDRIALQTARRTEIWFSKLEPRHRRLCGGWNIPDGEVAADVAVLAANLAASTPAPVSLVLSGRPGVGKTSIALAVASTAVMKGLVEPTQVAVIRVDDLIDRAVHAMPSEKTKVVDDVLDGVRFVVLDDLGRVGGAHPDVARRLIDAIVDRLWRQDVTVVATTNLTAAELRSALGDASYGRVIDDTPRKAVTRVTGTDRRLA